METIFDRYGGQEFWDVILSDFYVYNLQDPELSNYFEGKNVDKIKQMYRCLLSAALRTTGEHFPVSIKRVHKNMTIRSGTFEKFISNLLRALISNGVNAEDRAEIMNIIESFKEDVVKN